jgi:hypothetical protein
MMPQSAQNNNIYLDSRVSPERWLIGGSMEKHSFTSHAKVRVHHKSRDKNKCAPFWQLQPFLGAPRVPFHSASFS